MSVSSKENKFFLSFFSKYDWFGSGLLSFFFFFVSVCILMIKTCKQLVLGKIIWLTEIRAIYVKLSSA